MSHQGQMGIYFDSGGYTLLGTLFLAKGDEPKPTAFLLHGMPGIEKNYDLAQAMRSWGWNSLIFHYRGCWGSGGVFDFNSIPADVELALSEIISGKYPQVDPTQIILIGHSLGGWAAVIVGGMDKNVKGVVAIAPMAIPKEFHFSIGDAERMFCPWLPRLSPRDFVKKWNDLDDEFYPLNYVASIAPQPILIIHGSKDELVPISQSEALYERAWEPRELIIHPEANHSFVWHRNWLAQKIFKWLNLNFNWRNPN
jgi:dipeptidyl aminopeptidase/acylaminoacyl peptidase